MKKIFTLVAAVMSMASASAQALTDFMVDSYAGKLIVTINEVSTPENDANVIIEKVGDTSINLTLKNFILSSEDGDMPVGNVALTGIDLTANMEAMQLEFKAKQDIVIAAGDLEGVDMWMGPMLSDVNVNPTATPIPVELRGVAAGEDMDIDIDIDLQATLQQIVHVDFYAGKYTNGIANVKVPVKNNVTYNALGQRVAASAKGLVIKNGRKYVK